MNEYADYDYSPYDDEDWGCKLCGAEWFTECDCMVPDEWEDWYPIGRGGRDRKADLVNEFGLCPYCPVNRVENAKRYYARRRDRYKNKR